MAWKRPKASNLTNENVVGEAVPAIHADVTAFPEAPSCPIWFRLGSKRSSFKVRSFMLSRTVSNYFRFGEARRLVNSVT